MLGVAGPKKDSKLAMISRRATLSGNTSLIATFYSFCEHFKLPSQRWMSVRTAITRLTCINGRSNANLRNTIYKLVRTECNLYQCWLACPAVMPVIQLHIHNMCIYISHSSFSVLYRVRNAGINAERKWTRRQFISRCSGAQHARKLAAMRQRMRRHTHSVYILSQTKHLSPTQTPRCQNVRLSSRVTNLIKSNLILASGQQAVSRFEPLCTIF